MGMWVYQLSERYYRPGLFRTEIWENQRWHWQFGRKTGKANTSPVAGDTVVFFYAPTGCKEPGFYGWGVIDRCDSDVIYFTPTTPTNHLKMDPWNNDEATLVIGEIRHSTNQATLFPVPAKTIPKIRRGIKKWLSA
jgi:hypothetical protein